LSTPVNIADLRDRAKARLPKILFDWIDGGAGDEQGLRDNQDAFDRYRFIPRYMLDVSGRTQKKELLGRSYDSPFGIAPTGYAGIFRPGADCISAEAARRANIPYIMSGTSIDTIESAVEVAPDHCWYQLYGATDLAITKDLIARAERAGVTALVITIDIPVAAKRERDIRNGFSIPVRMTPGLVMDALMHPRWTVNYFRSGGMPTMANWAPYAPPGSGAMAVAEFANSHSYCVQTWDHLRLFRDLWPRSLIVKGVMHPQDAEIALRYGADGLIASNHGGRQYDRAATAPAMLPELRRAVGPDVPLMMDGGIRRGSDILTALCLGADFVFAGRAILYGTVFAGARGADLAIDILRSELDQLMGQIGCLDLDRSRLPAFMTTATGKQGHDVVQ